MAQHDNPYLHQCQNKAELYLKVDSGSAILRPEHTLDSSTSSAATTALIDHFRYWLYRQALSAADTTHHMFQGKTALVDHSLTLLKQAVQRNANDLVKHAGLR